MKNSYTATAAGDVAGKLPKRTYHLVQRQGTAGLTLPNVAILIGSSDSIDTIRKLQNRYRHWPRGTVIVIDAEGKEVK